jgi:phage-related tail fiber protein
MGTVTETTPATYPATVYQIEDGERADAGPLGPSNQAAINLANRTKWLKEGLDSKAPLASPAFTGMPTAPTPDAADSSTKLATTEYVTVLDALKAPLASPAFTGTPTAPTAASGTRTTQMATTAFVGAEVRLAAPPGFIDFYAAATPPDGWLKANGAAVSRTTYAALFAIIGTTFGSGDGSTTFTLPDLRGIFARGWDDGRGVDADRVFGSDQKGTLTTGDWDGVQSTGVMSLSTTAGQSGRAKIGADMPNATDYPNLQYAEIEETSYMPIANRLDVAGVMRPRNIALLACIKY